MDASRHDWLAGHAPLDLVVTLDGATDAIASAILFEEEGTASSFLDLAETIERHGLFCSLDADHGSHRVVTQCEEGRLDERNLPLRILGLQARRPSGSELSDVLSDVSSDHTAGKVSERR